MPASAVPLQLSAAGVEDMLRKGGILMLYKKACPSCTALHQRGASDSTIAQLASIAAKAGVRVGVANGPRLSRSLPASIAQERPFPAIFVSTRHKAEPQRYTGADRSAEAIWKFYLKQQLDGARLPIGRSRFATQIPDARQNAAEEDAAAEQVAQLRKKRELPPVLASHEEVRGFLLNTAEKGGLLLLTDGNELPSAEELERRMHAAPKATSIAFANASTIDPHLHPSLRGASGLMSTASGVTAL